LHLIKSYKVYILSIVLLLTKLLFKILKTRFIQLFVSINLVLESLPTQAKIHHPCPKAMAHWAERIQEKADLKVHHCVV
jgi:hypothetical protein